MKRLVVVLLALVFVLAMGCSVPPGVVKASEDMKTPVSAMANRYAALVKALKVKDTTKLDLLNEMEADLNQFAQLHVRVLDYMEGKDAFNVNDAADFATLALEIREKLKKDDDE